MDIMFKPTTEEEFLESVDRGLEQSRNGQARDAFESFNEITAELEAGYNAMNAMKAVHSQRAATMS